MKEPSVNRFLKRFKLSLAFTIITSLIFAAMIVCICADILPSEKMYIIAGAFWISLFLEILFSLLARKDRCIIILNPESSGSDLMDSGMLHERAMGKYSEVALFVSLTAMMFTLVVDVHRSWIQLAVFCMVFVSLNMCSIYNGKNYKYKEEIINIKGQNKNE